MSAGAALAAAVFAAGPAHAAAAGNPGPVTGFGGLCLDDRGASTRNFNPVQVYSCNGTDAQQWTLNTDGNTLHALGKCLDVRHGGTADGTPVNLYDCNGTGAQVWIPQNNGAFYNPQSNKCLDDTDWSTTPGTQAQIWDCAGNPNQSWSASAATAPAASSRKGVGVVSFAGVSSALAQSGASWYYTWTTTHTGIDGPANTGFVPMIWGPDSVTPTALAQAHSAGPYLLGFNEPDMAAQSNMTVDQALSLWPQLMENGTILGSPAVAYGADTPGGWLDRFMSGARANGYRVDFIALHWYGGDFDTPDAVNQLHAYIQAVHDRYHLPIWLTEYALIDFSNGGSRYPTDPQQAAFVTASTKMLAELPYLQRYAWFGLSASDTAPSTGLFRSGPVATDAGRAYEAAAG
ncbi:glycoside hydrolase family protein [Streptomyces sp. NPDC048527]|uniref:glycoside hydrolase family protein n=1 Tax=Streptomyces sp. NPDC048527 TaxID=3365568 RepID=UPI0037116138